MNGTVIDCRKQVEEAKDTFIAILSSTCMFRCFYKKYLHVPMLLQEVPACSDAFTRSTGVKVSQYKSAQLWLRDHVVATLFSL